MQVHRIQSNNPSFGYNPIANLQLIQLLEGAKKNKAFHNYVKDMCLLTIDAENALRKAEKKNQPELKNLLIASFLPAKILITDMVNYLFPQLDYRNKEMESYNNELEEFKKKNEKPEDHWQSGIVGVLGEHAAQDRADEITKTISDVIATFVPELEKVDYSGLNNAIREQYLAEGEELGEEQSLEERIKIGKTKCYKYEPKDESEKKGFDGLGGMEELKKTLKSDIVDFLKNPEQIRNIAKSYGIKIADAILLYGPPGCGKTSIIERLSVEADVPLLEITRDSIGSMYQYGPEIAIGAVFDYAGSIATKEKPVIVLIDDVDTVAGSRQNNLHQHEIGELGVFLKKVQSASKNNILVMAATNRYDGMDPALRRRFTEQIYVGLPDQKARESLIEHFLSGDECSEAQTLLADKEAITRLAQKAESLPISAIKNAITKAKKVPFLEAKEKFINSGTVEKRQVTEQDIENAMLLPEIQAQKEKEEKYKANALRKPVGFSNPKK